MLKLVNCGYRQMRKSRVWFRNLVCNKYLQYLIMTKSPFSLRLSYVVHLNLKCSVVAIVHFLDLNMLMESLSLGWSPSVTRWIYFNVKIELHFANYSIQMAHECRKEGIPVKMSSLC